MNVGPSLASLAAQEELEDRGDACLEKGGDILTGGSVVEEIVKGEVVQKGTGEEAWWRRWEKS